MAAYELHIRVVSECDAALLINTASATWYYDDDDNGNLDPRIILTNPQDGPIHMTDGYDECPMTRKTILAALALCGLATIARANEVAFAVDERSFSSNYACVTASERAVNQVASWVDFSGGGGAEYLWYQMNGNIFVTMKCYNNQLYFIHVHRIGDTGDAGNIRDRITALLYSAK